MLFDSLKFLIFFLAVLAVYRLLDHRNQNRFLLLASYVFYGAWDLRFLGLLILSTVVDFYVGLGLARESEPLRRRRWIWTSIAVNLSVLGFFKYFDFFSMSFTELAGDLGFSVSPITLHVILPVGISFYTFQAMSYTIDVYRGRIGPARKFTDFALYIAFFPQLVAGPIERARDLLPQIARPRTVTPGMVGSALYLILLGLFKKVVVADNLALVVDPIFGQAHATGEQVVIGSVFFAFQIYCDFSGYSDMARGLARLLGFELTVNFRQPFFVKSPGELFRRWHITLGNWMRDYLFQYLGGFRRNNLVTLRNVTVTMVLVGLWHGAAWNFVLWGLYVSLMLVAYRLYDVFVLPRMNSLLPASWRTPRNVVASLVMLLGTIYGFTIFRSQGFGQIRDFTAALGHFTSFAPLLSMGARFAVTAGPILLLDYLEHRYGGDESFMRLPLLVQGGAYASAMLLFFTVGNYDGGAFIYFQF